MDMHPWRRRCGYLSMEGRSKWEYLRRGIVAKVLYSSTQRSGDYHGRLVVKERRAGCACTWASYAAIGSNGWRLMMSPAAATRRVSAFGSDPASSPLPDAQSTNTLLLRTKRCLPSPHRSTLRVALDPAFLPRRRPLPPHSLGRTQLRQLSQKPVLR